MMKTMVFVGIYGALVLEGLAMAQQPSAPPSGPAHLTMPPITDTTAMPLQKVAQMLAQDPLAAAPVVPSVSTARSMAAGAQGAALAAPVASATGQLITTPSAKPPKLTVHDLRALKLGDEQKQADPMPVKGNDARIIFTFGEGLPTLITSPFHVSIIELEPGETVTGPPLIGDSVRWEILPATSGSGALTQPLIAVKPHESGLDTNLVITTNKRTYYLRLVSKDDEYIARVGFTYHEDAEAKWAAFLAEQQRAKQAAEDAAVITPTTGEAIEKMNYDYIIKGDNAVIRPIRVMDDGEKTYITMSDAVLHQELPTLVVIDKRLKGEKGEEIVNYRVKGNLYIVDRLFDKAALVLGVGKAVDKVTITRRVPLSSIPPSSTQVVDQSAPVPAVALNPAPAAPGAASLPAEGGNNAQ